MQPCLAGLTGVALTPRFAAAGTIAALAISAALAMLRAVPRTA
jgi:hypothetical protein